ncbi:MAG TPA: bifunctional [glutamine synthetase] adenylyltransferase/[glutamine synthetase]-adenylyl-L-tyrosine phosphorylase [Dermatophilaceae bacterium]|nr:bifunctional [glutamine synthetase] adenylyltransferase/[glutamine synthetase]-adenylyl-L-tyrosine phosphorylase [Dermatophilaceae bacterium]
MSRPASREVSRSGRLARLGFADPGRADRLLGDPALVGLVDPLDDLFGDGVVEAMGEVADPDQALLGLVRLMEALRRVERSQDLDHNAMVSDLTAALRHPGPAQSRLLAVLGGSAALADHLVSHPWQWVCVADARRQTEAERTEDLVRAVSPTGRGDRPAYDALRVAYRGHLLGIAALDLTAPDPTQELPLAAAALADLAAAALQAAFAIATEEVGPPARDCRLAVIGMGKCGGRELNYVSDVDVIFVAEPARPQVSEHDALAVGTGLATALMRACSAATAEGTLWPVDAALRPEGKNGPLVRTVDSHVQYYQRWAKTWEFQALLKARPVAGDAELAQRYLAAVHPMVWQAASRDRFVEDVQAMRRRVEQHVPAAEAARQLKLGPGGLRDVEFSVQLLQLVHGRSDDTLRSGTTLDALGALSAGGYVAREDAAELEDSYRFLRVLEHRIQLHRVRRTHLMPTGAADLRRLGRAVGHRREPAKEVVAQWKAHSRQVRRIHEQLFYRPLLIAVARLSTSEARLTPEAARERLAALGFRDPAGAMRHLEALTAGVSRRAAIQRTLLPVMLGWFAQEAAPDAGLLAFRKISDSLGSTHWYLRMLRDEGSSAERLAHVLARSRYAAELLIGTPESVAVLGDDTGLTPRPREALVATMRAAMRRKHSPEEAITAARVVRRQELFRIAVADLTGQLSLDRVGAALTDLTAATLQAALDVAIGRVEAELDSPLPARLAVVGMGRLGGAEMSYGSDADVLFVFDADPATPEDKAVKAATAVVQEMRRLLGAAGPDPQLVLDADLRPEGKSGPLARSLAGYQAYYQRWALTWEAQALLRACPVAGDEALGARFVAMVDRYRYPAAGLSSEAVREVRLLKARMESERLPRGADPKTHVKLGLGGLSDVEWTVQLIQLQHGYAVPQLRTTGTIAALHAAVAAGFVRSDEGEALEQAWRFASALRNASLLWRGRGTDSLPSDLQDADGIGRIVGRPAGTGAELAEIYRRLARRARIVVRRLFYEAA